MNANEVATKGVPRGVGMETSDHIIYRSANIIVQQRYCDPCACNGQKNNEMVRKSQHAEETTSQGV